MNHLEIAMNLFLFLQQYSVDEWETLKKLPVLSIQQACTLPLYWGVLGCHILEYIL